ncbi:hypothetical protein [Mycobacterium deserti]|uniref:Outer membrane protein n=1 Tax=Mycobacterium deserti TaxID=2978347 RepID=A0ABT2MEJ5_9MYCO|nr:hypothetical protein [Mycobacterium deserti]MCT7660688.1 hypothetical protein [Mycobacterium deserti]
MVDSSEDADAQQGSRRNRLGRAIAFAVLPTLAFLLTASAGYLKWQNTSVRDSQSAAAQSVQAAKDTTIAMLSYQPDTVGEDLGSVNNRLTGQFLESYTSLVNEIVIPGAKQKQIAAVASVPAAGAVSATESHAVVLVFVNQTTVIGSDPPTETTSSARVTLDKVNGTWLVSQFEPI